MKALLEHPFASGVLPHLLTVGGFLLALFLIARLMSEKRQPTNTVAWLLVILLIPYLGVPFYLIFGGRKLKRLVARKAPLPPGLASFGIIPSPVADRPVARTLTASGAPPPVAGNRLRYLTFGEEAYAALEEQIRSAQHSISIMTFILGRDDTGRRIVALLAQRAREGVKVRLLLDSVGSFFSSRHFVQPLRKAGGEVARFMPVLPFTTPGWANLRNHRKIALFDNCTALVGGHNLAREYMGPVFRKKRWADFGAVIEGPAVALLDEVFAADWCFATGQPKERLQQPSPPPGATQPAGRSELQIVASGPDTPGDALYEGIIEMIQEARKSIWIITPYFIPDEVLYRSLLVKARAGCPVTLILPARSNHRIADFARRHYVRELRSAGVTVMHYGPGMLHGKTVIVDDRIGLFGSANFDHRSLFVNFEIGVLVHTESDVLGMKAWAEKLLQSCHPPKPERQRKHRFMGNIAEDLCRMLAPLL